MTNITFNSAFNIAFNIPDDFKGVVSMYCDVITDAYTSQNFADGPGR